MIEMPGDLLGATARGEMLGAVQRRPALFGGELEQVLRDERDGAACAAFPRRVGGGVHDDLHARRASRRDGTRSGRRGSARALRPDGRRLVTARVEMAQARRCSGVFDGRAVAARSGGLAARRRLPLSGHLPAA